MDMGEFGGDSVVADLDAIWVRVCSGICTARENGRLSVCAQIAWPSLRFCFPSLVILQQIIELLNMNPRPAASMLGQKPNEVPKPLLEAPVCMRVKGDAVCRWQ